MQQPVCPRDGQTLDWHLKFWELTGADAAGRRKPRFFGDILGCGFISPLERAAALDRFDAGVFVRVPTNLFPPEDEDDGSF